MDYHKDQIRFATSQTYLRLPLRLQAAHAWLVRLCAQRENGGTLAGAAQWTDRDWRAATWAQLGSRDVRALCAGGVCAIEGHDVRVHGYDRRGEDACLAERARVQEYRERTRTRPRTVPEASEHQSSPVQTRPVQSSPSAASAPPPARSRDDAADADADGLESCNLDHLRHRSTVPIGPLRAAIRSGDPVLIAEACGATKRPDLAGEWRAAADGLQTGVLVTILLWRLAERDAVRLPRGLTHARRAWLDLEPTQRSALAERFRDQIGVAA